MRKFTLPTWFVFALLIASGSAVAQNANLSITKTDKSRPGAGGYEPDVHHPHHQYRAEHGDECRPQRRVADGTHICFRAIYRRQSARHVYSADSRPDRGTFNCTYPTLAANQNSQYSVTLNVPAGSSGSISNTATVTSDTAIRIRPITA
jgi:hypothetical protein